LIPIEGTNLTHLEWKKQVKQRYNLENDYDSKRPEWIVGMLFSMELDEISKNIKRGSILEVGVGTGRLITRIGKNRYIVGLDIARSLLRIARDKIKESGISCSRCNLICADVDHLPLRTEAFDNIVISRSIKFFPDLGGSLSKLREILKNRGRLILTTDYAKDSVYYKFLVPRYYHKMSTEKHYSLKEVAEVARINRFTLIRERSLMSLPPTFYKHSPWFLWDIARRVDNSLSRFGKGWFFLLACERVGVQTKGASRLTETSEEFAQVIPPSS
jgi:ubiquinone/menaquinone biosynthesis C-methylase UbiE